MGITRIRLTDRLRRGAPGAVALTLVMAGILAGTGTAAAAQHGAMARRGTAAGREAGRLAAAGTISTVAGGLGGPAKGTKVAIGNACGVAYGAGEVYVGGATVVRKLDPASGQVAPKAGDGLERGLGQPPPNGGPAADANLGDACTTAVDHHGNLLILDTGGGSPSGAILVVAAKTGTFYGERMTAGNIYNVAKTIFFGISLDGGLAVDPAGNLVITSGPGGALVGNTVEVVPVRTGTFYGQRMLAGGIYVVAGNGHRGFSGDGGPALEAKLNDPGGVAVDSAGNLVFTDYENFRVRVVAVKSGTFYGKKMTAGDIYTVAGNGKFGFSGDGGPATAAELNNPADVVADGAGNLVIADLGNSRVRVVAVKSGTFYGKEMTAGDIYTVAGNGKFGFSGDGGPATAAELNEPDVRVDGSGNLVIADNENFRVRVVAVKAGTFYGKKMTRGDIYTVAGNGTQDSSGNGGPALRAEFDPGSIAVDGAGNMLIPDINGNQIRLVATTTGTFYGKKMTAGDIYGVVGNGTAGFSGDGGPATAAELNNPADVVADGAGNLVIADPENSRIRVVAVTAGTFYGRKMTAGDIYTVAGNGKFGFSGDGGPATKAKLWLPQGVAVDGAGNLVIADNFNNRIRVVAVTTGTFYGVPMTAGDIYTVAGDGTAGFSGDGGPATAAELSIPESGDVAAVDGAGNLVITDRGNNRVRVVAAKTGTFYGQAMTAGDIYTVAGDGSGLFFGDGGPATAAGMIPVSAAVDAAGNLLIADGNNRVRVVAAKTGTFYGQAMTAGDIYTVAGNGTCGFSGDGGRGTAAALCSPQGVSGDGAGNLLIAEQFRIREVAG